jgi:hypothetical protein
MWKNPYAKRRNIHRSLYATVLLRRGFFDLIFLRTRPLHFTSGLGRHFHSRKEWIL